MVQKDQNRECIGQSQGGYFVVSPHLSLESRVNVQMKCDRGAESPLTFQCHHMNTHCYLRENSLYKLCLALSKAT